MSPFTGVTFYQRAGDEAKQAVAQFFLPDAVAAENCAERHIPLKIAVRSPIMIPVPAPPDDTPDDAPVCIVDGVTVDTNSTGNSVAKVATGIHIPSTEPEPGPGLELDPQQQLQPEVQAEPQPQTEIPNDLEEAAVANDENVKEADNVSPAPCEGVPPEKEVQNRSHAATTANSDTLTGATVESELLPAPSGECVGKPVDGGTTPITQIEQKRTEEGSSLIEAASRGVVAAPMQWNNVVKGFRCGLATTAVGRHCWHS